MVWESASPVWYPRGFLDEIRCPEAESPKLRSPESLSGQGYRAWNKFPLGRFVEYPISLNVPFGVPQGSLSCFPEWDWKENLFIMMIDLQALTRNNLHVYKTLDLCTKMASESWFITISSSKPLVSHNIASLLITYPKCSIKCFPNKMWLTGFTSLSSGSSGLSWCFRSPQSGPGGQRLISFTYNEIMKNFTIQYIKNTLKLH